MPNRHRLQKNHILNIEPDLIEFENTYKQTDFTEIEGDLFGAITIDGYPDPELSDQGAVVATVYITNKGDTIVSWHHNGYRMHKTVLSLIEESKAELKNNWQQHFMTKMPKTYKNGFVEIELSEIINTDLEGFLDLISERLINSCLLSDISYTIVTAKPNNTLVLQVSGEPLE